MLAEFVKRFDKREFRLLLGGALMLVLAGSVSYGLVPQWKGLSAARVKLEALEDLPVAGDVSDQLQTMRDMVRDLEHTLHGEAGELPARELEAYLIGKLQSISWSNSVDLDSVRPGQRQRIRGFWETSFQIDISGEYSPIYRWMNEMREQLGFVVIKEFTLTPVRGDRHEPILRASMTIASYQGN